MAFFVDTEEHETAVVLAVRGEIDLATAPTLREALVDAIARDVPRVVVDLEGVGFIDSAGLGVLLGALKRMRGRGGDLEIVCTSRNLLTVFEITGLDRTLTILPAREPVV